MQDYRVVAVVILNILNLIEYFLFAYLIFVMKYCQIYHRVASLKKYKTHILPTRVRLLLLVGKKLLVETPLTNRRYQQHRGRLQWGVETGKNPPRAGPEGVSCGVNQLLHTSFVPWCHAGANW
jgi:hypothetical protein